MDEGRVRVRVVMDRRWRRWVLVWLLRRRWWGGVNVGRVRVWMWVRVRMGVRVRVRVRGRVGVRVRVRRWWGVIVVWFLLWRRRWWRVVVVWFLLWWWWWW
ncbi:hypothetical protein P7M08_23885 [Vibrio parahaemolyticus]|nr:hypothetical protein [Vibrio parahaemolyticus]NMR88963.1 hypothetical protein [Vibrio parahaemolyticus]